MSNPVISWAKENPLPAGAAALGVIVITMMLFGGGGDDESGGGNATAGAPLEAYYMAVSNQAAAGAQVQIEQIKANAGTNQALIASTYGIEKAKIEQPAVLASIEATRSTTIDSNQKQYDLGVQTLQHQHAMYDNYINLENSRLAQEQNIAFKQANVANKANKRGFIGGLFSTIVGGATSVLTGGTSTLAGSLFKVAGGGSKTALPNAGGTWV